MDAPVDVVLFKVDVDNHELASLSRGTTEEAQRFCKRPWWPYKTSEHFVAVDNWGWNTGSIVAATPSLSNWIGKTFADFQRDGRFRR